MKYKQFEVVKLKNEYYATILGIEDNEYKTEIVDKKGNRIEIRRLTDDEIQDVIFKK